MKKLYLILLLFLLSWFAIKAQPKKSHIKRMNEITQTLNIEENKQFNM